MIDNETRMLALLDDIYARYDRAIAENMAAAEAVKFDSRNQWAYNYHSGVISGFRLAKLMAFFALGSRGEYPLKD